MIGAIGPNVTERRSDITQVCKSAHRTGTHSHQQRGRGLGSTQHYSSQACLSVALQTGSRTLVTSDHFIKLLAMPMMIRLSDVTDGPEITTAVNMSAN